MNQNYIDVVFFSDDDEVSLEEGNYCIICPVSGKAFMRDDTYFPDDYIENYHMIWGNNGEYVLNIPIVDENLESIETENIESFKKSYENDLTPEIHLKIEKEYKDYYKSFTSTFQSFCELKKNHYKIELLKIKSVVPHSLYGSFISNTKLNNSDILTLTKEIKILDRKGLDYNDYKQEINKYIKQNYPSVSFSEDEYDKNSENILNLGYELNTYNLFDCKETEMTNHGGVTMLLELENGDIMYVSGD
jgi:hypothetical protein